MDQLTEGPATQKERDPLAGLHIPSHPVDWDTLKREMEQAELQLKPFRTPVTEEVLTAIIK